MVLIPNPCLTVAVLDAGQGDCIVIKFPKGTVWLVDCGSSKSKGVITPEIQTALTRLVPRNGQIARLVLTHADTDHYNLLAALLKGGISFGEIYYGCDLSLYGGEAAIRAYLKRMHDAKWTHSPGAFYYGGNQKPIDVEGVKVWLLAANATGRLDSDDGPIKNGNSIVLLLKYGPTKIFLMGDATAVTERFILNCERQGSAVGLLANLGVQRGNAWVGGTVLKVGHHGSETSSCEEWIREIGPDSLIISSDTKTWSGSGIPDDEHVRDIMFYKTPAMFRAHQVVTFDRTLAPPLPPPRAPAKPPRGRPTGKPRVALKKKRIKKPPQGRFKAWSCDKAFMTTLNHVSYGGDSESPADAAGQSWYWFVGKQGDIAVVPTEELRP